MSPRKQPSSLIRICVKNCISLINSACYFIEKTSPDHDFYECERQALALRYQLMTLLPARLFDLLCANRMCCRYKGDPQIKLQVLMHPNITVFCKCEADDGIPQQFWMDNLPTLSRLIVLDLKFICTDEILEIISVNCPLIEELNIVSRVTICKSLFNASVLVRYVSGAGLAAIAKLKQLRVLTMDPPKNERANRMGRCVTQTGIILLISKLPYLEELRIDTCDIGSTIIGTETVIGPISLKKVNCHRASADGIKKLIKICPFLREFSLTHLSGPCKDAILEQITSSELRLNKLDLSFFSFSPSMQNLLIMKGSYLTHFSLWDTEETVTLDAVLNIGIHCPNLISLCLMTQSMYFTVPPYFRYTHKIFTKLTSLSIGNENFNIEKILTFFLKCTQNLNTIIIKYQNKTSIEFDTILVNSLKGGCLEKLIHLWLDCTLKISKETVKKIIEKCEHLQMLTLDFPEDVSDIQQYISSNNLDLKLGSY